MYHAARKTIPIIQTGVGTPNGRPIPNQPNRSALSVNPVLTGLPLVYTMVTPRSSSIITRVAINACTRPFATITPVTAPIAAPSARAAATATSALTSIPTMEAATAPVSAMMAFTDVCWRMLNRLLTVKKLGLMVETIAISTNRAMSDFCSRSHALVK